MIFVLVLALCVLRLIRLRGLYLLSMFTIPILLSSGLVIYKILQLPGLSSVLQRVDVEDVTTFNGRAFLWRDAMDWLVADQRGIFFGNGHKGHYFLDLISGVAKLWNEKDVHHMHLHSTSMEILVSQGVILFLLFAFLFYKIYTYYRSSHQMDKEEGAFLPVIVFLLFLMQVDNFLYVDGLGFVIFSLLVAKIAITSKAYIKRPISKANRDRIDYVREPHQWSAVS
jgi:O-antigen ligase